MASSKTSVRLGRNPRVKRRSWTGSLFGLSSRILFWYTLATVLLRCPSSVDDLSEQSPAVCNVYFDAKSQLAPLVTPYYHEYAAEYVNWVRPYTDVLGSKVYTPVAKLVNHNYQKHGAHHVAQGQTYMQEQWQQIAAPHTEKLSTYLRMNYEKTLKPYVGQIAVSSKPYLNSARNAVVHNYHTTAVPLFRKSVPYASNVYLQGRKFALDVVVPNAKHAGQKSWIFLSRKAWPTIRILYGENIEPQVSKIRERLASYRDGKKLEAAVEAMTSPSALSVSDYPSPESVVVSSLEVETLSSSSTVSGETNNPTEINTFAAPPTAETTPMSATAIETGDDDLVTLSTALSISTSAEEIITMPPSTPASAETTIPSKPSTPPVTLNVSEELQIWEDKFTKACEIGKADLQERIEVITARQVENQVRGLGEAFLTRLEEAASSGLEDVRFAIQRAVRSLPEEFHPEDNAAAEELVHDIVRSAAGSVKARAQDLRSWKAQFDMETLDLAEAALESTLNVVDHIRDLGLQEIGMRWASMPEVTYKDWSAYYALKKSVDEWRNEVQVVAQEHTGLTHARSEAEEIESKGMIVAEKTAKGLAHLMKVAKRKIADKDVSDDFDTTGTMSSLVGNAEDKIREKINEASQAILGTASDGQYPTLAKPAETPSSTASELVEAISTDSAPIKVAATSAQESASSIIDYVTSMPAAAIESLTEQVSGAVQSVTESIESASSTIAEAMPSISSTVEEQYAPEKSFAQSVLSAPKFKATEVAGQVIGSRPPPPPSPQSYEFDEEISHGASTLSSFTSGVAPIGTIAPSADGIKSSMNDIIRDGSHRASMSIQSAVSKAGTAYADVTNSLAQALRESQREAEHTVSV